MKDLEAEDWLGLLKVALLGLLFILLIVGGRAKNHCIQQPFVEGSLEANKHIR